MSNSRHLTRHALPLTLADCWPKSRFRPSGREDAEESMTPRRIVAAVLSEQFIDVVKFPCPYLRVCSDAVRNTAKVAEHPLSISPGVIVLRIFCEDTSDEVELQRRIVVRRDNELPMLPEGQVLRQMHMRSLREHLEISKHDKTHQTW